MPFSTLIASEMNGVFTITLNRPDKRNSISYEMIDDLVRAFSEAEHSSAQVVIMTGAGKAFCAGMDLEGLKGLAGRTQEQGVQDSQTMAWLFRTVYEFPKVTIAAVNGAAIAGGTGLATICDLTLAVPQAKFGYTEVRIGFIPAIVSFFLVSQVGDKRARDLLLTGRIFDAQEALRLGLVTEIVPEESLLQRAQEVAAGLLENSPASLRATKKLLAGYMKDELDRRIEEAVRENAAIRSTPDFIEGISSFLEKRKPVWR